MKKWLIWSLIFVLLVSNVLAVCTVTFGKETYKPSETITATMSCSEQGEKNTAYNLSWYNATGGLLERDSGTTPTVAGTNFFQTYTIPSTYNTTIWGNLTGTGLEGFDFANVSGSNINSLIITNALFSPTAFLGKSFSVDFTVTDENDKKVSNAHCLVYGTDNNSAPLQVCGETHSHDGRAVCQNDLHTEDFVEGNNYLAKIRCTCGVGDDACIDEDGNVVNASAGSNTYPFSVNTWLVVNTVVDETEYVPREEIVICVNLTNSQYGSRIPVEIYHQVRCSANDDNDDDLDRSLIIYDANEPDERGISANTTQMQCKRFRIPEVRYLEGKSSECYASTTTWVLDEQREKVIGYATTSPSFNITSDELNLMPDWVWINDNRWNTIINLSKKTFHDYNGSGIGNIDLKINTLPISDKPSEQFTTRELHLTDFITVTQIKNISAFNRTSAINYNFEVLDDGSIEIELVDVDISRNGWYNVTIVFENFDQREANALDNISINSKYLQELDNQTVALEDIANKTGTFHFEIDCQDVIPVGHTLNCTISAQVEATDQLQKEVDFTCYIKDGANKYNERNFNQMVNTTRLYIKQTFGVPYFLTVGNEYQVYCGAGYYNLGFREDIFYTSFTTISSGSFPPPIDLVGKIDEVTPKVSFIGDTIEAFSNLTKLDYLILLIGIILTIIIIWQLLRCSVKATILAIILSILWWVVVRLIAIF